MEKKLNRKEMTKAKIREAFWETYATKSIERITVRELTDIAGINRVTFYTHYSDIYAIRDELEQEVLQRVREWQQLDLQSIHDEAYFLRQMKALAEIVSYYGPYIQIIIGKHGDFLFGERIAQEFRMFYLERNKEMSVQKRYIAEIVLSTQISLVFIWIKNDQDMPIEELARLWHRALHSGLDGLDVQ